MPKFTAHVHDRANLGWGIIQVTVKKIIYHSKLALTGVRRVFSRPTNAVVALIIAFLFTLLVFLIINNGFYGSLLMSRLPVADKLGVLGSMTHQMFVEFFTTFNGSLLLLVGLLQGITLTLLIYTIRQNRLEKNVTAATQLGSTGFAAIAAAIGLGCVPCGTSLLLPLATIFFSGSAAVSAVSTMSLVILVAALLLCLYSIYKIAQVAYVHTENEVMSKKESRRDKKS